MARPFFSGLHRLIVSEIVIGALFDTPNMYYTVSMNFPDIWTVD